LWLGTRGKRAKEHNWNVNWVFKLSGKKCELKKKRRSVTENVKHSNGPKKHPELHGVKLC